MPSTIQFQEVQIGQFFEFRGRGYRKLALTMASDEERNGTIFMAETEVLLDPFAHLGVTRQGPALAIARGGPVGVLKGLAFNVGVGV